MAVPWWSRYRYRRCRVRPAGPGSPLCPCRRSGCRMDARPSCTPWILSHASACRKHISPLRTTTINTVPKRSDSGPYRSTTSRLFTSQIVSKPPTAPAARKRPQGDQDATLTGCKERKTTLFMRNKPPERFLTAEPGFSFRHFSQREIQALFSSTFKVSFKLFQPHFGDKNNNSFNSPWSDINY